MSVPPYWMYFPFFKKVHWAQAILGIISNEQYLDRILEANVDKQPNLYKIGIFFNGGLKNRGLMKWLNSGISVLNRDAENVTVNMFGRQTYVLASLLSSSSSLPDSFVVGMVVKFNFFLKLEFPMGPVRMCICEILLTAPGCHVFLNGTVLYLFHTQGQNEGYLWIASSN